MRFNISRKFRCINGINLIYVFGILIYINCLLYIFQDRKKEKKLNDWKDDWIKNWINEKIKNEEKQYPQWYEDNYCGALNRMWQERVFLQNDSYFDNRKYKIPIKQYMPARCIDKRVVKDQLISRVIWQTWKNTEVGVQQYKSMSSVILLNPDYEYIMFTDDDCKDFICKFYDENVQRAYSLLKPGAAKADIWRLAITLKYGGIYVDSDAASLKSFSHLIFPNSSVVSGKGVNGDLHQWVLAYAPKHPFIREALNVIVKNVLDAYKNHTFYNVIQLTGPDSFHFKGVAPVLRRNNCTVDARETNFELVKEGQPCSKTKYPEQIGILQIFDSDYFNYSFNFKIDGIDREKAEMNKGYQRYYDIYEFEELFNHQNESIKFCNIV